MQQRLAVIRSRLLYAFAAATLVCCSNKNVPKERTVDGGARTAPPPPPPRPIGDRSARAVRLKELLGGAPSEGAFICIRALFEPEGLGGSDEHRLPPWSDVEARREALGRASAALATWDDELRILQANGDSKAIPDWGRLVRRFVVYRRDETAGAAVDQLIGSPSLADVAIVEVLRCEFPWKRLAGSPNTLRPKRLIVSNTVVTDSDWSALTKGTLSRLERLELRKGAGPTGPLLDALPRLSRIQCSECSSEFPPLRVVLERPALVRRLEHLEFSSSYLTDSDIDALVLATELARLRVLDLRGNDRFSAAAKLRLRAAPQFAKTSVLTD